MQKAMEKTVKLTTILTILITLTVIFSNFAVFAGETFIKPGELTGSAPSESGIVDIGNSIIGIITTVGIVVAVIIVLVIGIKYIMGSAAEKAEYKKTMIPYLVGAVLLFGGSAIVNVIYNLAKITPATSGK